MHPPIPTLNRECTKDWQLPGTNSIIEKGTAVIISIYAIHMDPVLHPQPEIFRPDRFHSATAKSQLAYFPFGDGPRVCIAQRLGKMQAKVGLVLLLQKYNFELAGNTKKPLKISPATFLMVPVGGIQLKVTKR